MKNVTKTRALSFSAPSFGRNAFLFVLFFLSILLTSASVWIERNFGAVSVREIVFTLTFSLEGAPADMMLGSIEKMGLAVLASILFVILFQWGAGRIGRKWAKRTVYLAPIILFLGSAAYADSKFSIFQYVMDGSRYGDFIDDHYVMVPNDELVFPAKRKNVVFIVLESMENSFQDESLAGNLTPRLQALQERNVHFRGSKQITGTGWTVAGLTSYFFGVPLLLPIEGNSYDARYSGFLPNAPSLIGALDKNGYRVNLISGADASFGGKKKIFATHSANFGLYDKPYFIASGLDQGKGETCYWGFNDRYLYEQAKTILLREARGKQPFFTVIQTVDTHSRALSYGDYPEKYGDDRDSFVAADHMATEFIAWLRKQKFYKDTIVVVAGDHLYMADDVGGVPLPREKRSVFNLFLNTKLQMDSSHRYREYSSVDMAPTLLEAMGVTLPERRYGLGVSLFSDQPTLIEQYGFETVDAAMRKRSHLYNQFF